MSKADEIAREVAGADWPQGCGAALLAADRALEWAAQQSESEPRVWASGAPDPQRRIAARIRAGKSTNAG